MEQTAADANRMISVAAAPLSENSDKDEKSRLGTLILM
jgi:hypothetical protein